MATSKLADGFLASGCQHDEHLLNPDAVAVRWYRCSKCGRTRSEQVQPNQPIWEHR